MKTYESLKHAVREAERLMVAEGESVKPKFWQATDVSAKPEAEMRELLYFNFTAPLPPNMWYLEKEVNPNMPWAEDHFQERVGGKPVNPGTTWVDWPWSNSADKHRISQGNSGKFNHNYMERYWPKLAGRPVLEVNAGIHKPHMGIRYEYGDLLDVVKLISQDVLTRQAYMPVFFPEDTGAVHGGRIPCSIGYHFMVRDNKLNVVYQLRSCDLFRHFRDDLYLTGRLTQWIQEELEISYGIKVDLGNIHVMISSLHLFINDYHALTTRLSKESD